MSGVSVSDQQLIDGATDALTRIESNVNTHEMPREMLTTLVYGAMSEIHAAISELAERLTDLRAENERLIGATGEGWSIAATFEERLKAAEKQLTEAIEALDGARDMVLHWAGYASEYFQEKWDLKADVAKINAALKRLAAPQKEPCERCDGSGVAVGERYGETTIDMVEDLCRDCGGTGVAATQKEKAS